ncbi:MAG: intradiol ring-cleavage dioxygenase [Anaerolineae bacterium]|nr:intradiol ring-cleavage dioxygenase [Anaerolineae bacterium]
MNPQPDVHEDNDDRPVGRVLSRREVLALLGSASAAMLFGGGLKQVAGQQATLVATAAATESALPSCVVRPEMTEGPYFVDEMLNRSDIRSDPSDGTVKPGVPLRLIFRVSEVTPNACTPLKGAQVDVWHCDALGVYSGVTDRSFHTKGQQFLRGYQVTDTTGKAEFLTIYPGWYPGRAVHIHFKIRTDPQAQAGYEFTSQLFFDDALSDAVFKQQPYASKGAGKLPNSRDGIYRNGGDQLLLNVIKDGDGYTATFNIGIDTSQPHSDTGSPSQDAPQGGPRGGQPQGGRGPRLPNSSSQ